MKTIITVVFIFTITNALTSTESAPINEEIHCTPTTTINTSDGVCICNDDGKSVTCEEKSVHGHHEHDDKKEKQERKETLEEYVRRFDDRVQKRIQEDEMEKRIKIEGKRMQEQMVRTDENLKTIQSIKELRKIDDEMRKEQELTNELSKIDLDIQIKPQDYFKYEVPKFEYKPIEFHPII